LARILAVWAIVCAVTVIVSLALWVAAAGATRGFSVFVATSIAAVTGFAVFRRR
jgi:hypothetical protein